MTKSTQIQDACDDIPYRPLYPEAEITRSWSARRYVVRLRCVAEARRAASASATQQEKAEQFKTLVSQWRRETATAGHLSKIVMHPAYQRIMAMGPDVIRLILQEMEKEPGHWFWALHNLVPPGQDPAEGTTTIREATQAWLAWGRREGIIR